MSEVPDSEIREGSRSNVRAMDDTPMPEPLRRAVHQLVAEAVQNCQEVLRSTEPDLAGDWQRMTLCRATDAADTLDMTSLLIAAYCQRTGMSQDTLSSYLQARQQRSRAAGPQDCDRQEVAGLLNGPAPDPDDREAWLRFSWGHGFADAAQTYEDSPQRLLTQACLHGLQARLCDDVEALDSYLPPRIAALARKIAQVLEEP
ncbi:hypothetical protein [Streptomyces sp. NPDC046862]|uniref:hypothetical protein n=1 Tax=Streptomyces sp. NPDC046862 TaxID=3154603 RepID=UPI0034513C3E